MTPIGNGYIRRWGDGISYGTAPNIGTLQDWRLATNDDAATVQTAGYFNAFAKQMKPGERIFASLDLDGAPQAKDYMVTSNNGTVVVVALQVTT